MINRRGISREIRVTLGCSEFSFIKLRTCHNYLNARRDILIREMFEIFSRKFISTSTYGKNAFTEISLKHRWSIFLFVVPLYCRIKQKKSISLLILSSLPLKRKGFFCLTKFTSFTVISVLQSF